MSHSETVERIRERIADYAGELALIESNIEKYVIRAGRLKYEMRDLNRELRRREFLESQGIDHPGPQIDILNDLASESVYRINEHAKLDARRELITAQMDQLRREITELTVYQNMEIKARNAAPFVGDSSPKLR